MNQMTIDMSEVLRLTRAGDLGQALARLRGERGGKGETLHPAAGPHPPRSKTAPGGVIDMVAPATPGGSWTPPTFTTSRTKSSGPSGTVAAPGIPDFVRSILDDVGARLGESGLPGLSGSPGLSGLDGVPGLAPKGRAVPLPDGARFETRTFTNEAGTRPYKLYVPSGYEGGSPVPLVVMLHGCTQTPDDFAAGTRMNGLAEEQGFLVVYPDQPKTAHPQRCWKWFNADDQRRGRGEPSIIAGLTREVVSEFAVDPTRVYVAGLSAGGAAAAIMGSEYPDLFAAVGVHSGLACGSARDLPSALAAMRSGAAVRARGGRRIVPTVVFHGDSDKIVHAANGDNVIAGQLGSELRAVTTSGTAEAGRAYTRTAYTDDAGREWLVHWSIAGGGHAWMGGSAAGSYTDGKGPDASREMLRFFAEHANEPDR